MTRGIAHVSFSGGGMFMPARDPYDRQMLAEHVLSWVRTSGKVQVLIGSERWIVHQRRGSSGVCCVGCGCRIGSACYFAAGDPAPYCVTCALGDRAEPAQLQPMTERRMSS